MSEKRRRRRKTSGDSEESEEENDKAAAEVEVIAFMQKKSGRGKHSVVNLFYFRYCMDCFKFVVFQLQQN